MREPWQLRPADFPIVRCLCGSTRFGAEFEKQNWLATLEGKIVLSIGVLKHGPTARVLGAIPMNVPQELEALLKAAKRAEESEECRNDDGSHLFYAMVNSPIKGCEDCVALAKLQSLAIPAVHTVLAQHEALEKVRQNKCYCDYHYPADVECPHDIASALDLSELGKAMEGK